ncbi:hypothetical protein [Terribacillus saccharophilus]|uniref:hypothetical protein n=1 Tax=Terribacillus saccharophilus TaxID=361277 RepID=UPI0015CF4396|nr:hypothetical protein [Terribacillus saccharophilus]
MAEAEAVLLMISYQVNALNQVGGNVRVDQGSGFVRQCFLYRRPPFLIEMFHYANFALTLNCILLSIFFGGSRMEGAFIGFPIFP